ncbi:hypothetical protein F5Y15DRAFT_412978 [Xylariaceae sp. FL0016]|nr:hypothetical protein F5Y15DRAFT_412978 [Xylariaceae sp. FL0016]
MASEPTADIADSTPDDAAPAPQIPDNRTQTPPSSDAPPNTRRCFVCLVDEPEASLPADWSTPCTCSLEGHSECLMTWVNDLEAQGKEIKCPQCKSTIIITERWDPAIQLSNYLNKKFSNWTPKILLGFIASGALASSSIYGLKAIDWFAGPEATIAFLFKSENIPLFRLIRRGAQRDEPPVNLLHFSLLPFIAPALVINRMNIGDVVAIPASLVYATLFNDANELLTWPPSPERAVALYPAVKASYFHLHKVLTGRLERIWTARAAAIQVDPSQHHEFAQNAPAHQPEGGGIFDLELDIQLGGNDDEGNAAEEGQPNRNADSASRSPINFITGALLWPGVCYGMGEILRHVMPSRFVGKAGGGPTTGLLQERWGRSLVGGCLFVVLKDAFFLYVKYRKTMNAPYRRIRNSDRRNIHN